MPLAADSEEFISLYHQPIPSSINETHSNYVKPCKYLHLQRVLELHPSVPLRLHDCSASPGSRALCLRASTSSTLQHLQHASELRSLIPPFLHIYTPATHLHRSIPPYFHVTTPAARLER